MTNYAQRLEDSVRKALPRLKAINESEASLPHGEDGWSAKEIIGHLIDSASNNHGRFVLALSKSDLVFPGYDQEHWVKSQRYNEAVWSELIILWERFNLHLARVMRTIPEAKRNAEIAEHSLDKIAWKTVPLTQSTSLGYLMNDYVDHLQHHLEQIWSLKFF